MEEDQNENSHQLEKTLTPREPSVLSVSACSTTSVSCYSNASSLKHFLCNTCSKGFPSKETVNCHIIEIHKETMPEDAMEIDQDINDLYEEITVIGNSPKILRAGNEADEKHLDVKDSPIHGKGLFTSAFIRSGEFVIQYHGEILSKKESLRRQMEYYKEGIDNYFMASQGLMIDATIIGNCARYINNSCDPNCEAENIIIRDRRRFIIKAKRDIEPEEELTFDYQFVSEELVACRCGAANCRKTLNSNLEKLKLDNSLINQILRARDAGVPSKNLSTKSIKPSHNFDVDDEGTEEEDNSGNQSQSSEVASTYDQSESEVEALGLRSDSDTYTDDDRIIEIGNSDEEDTNVMNNNDKNEEDEDESKVDVNEVINLMDEYDDVSAEENILKQINTSFSKVNKVIDLIEIDDD